MSSIALVLLVLLLLSGLALLGMDPQAAHYDKALATMTRFSMAESTLQQEILSARSGLLHNYDPLNQKMDELDHLLAELRQQGMEDPTLRSLDDIIGQQNRLGEQFKTDNALLQNSLAYFGLLTSQFGNSVQDGPLASAMSDLSNSILHLMLDTTAEAAKEADDGLSRLAVQETSDADKDLVNGLLAHGRIIYRLLPETDHVLKSLYDLQRSHPQEAVRASILAHQKASRAVAGRYRLMLYATSLLLLVLLLDFGAKLRRHVLALRRRAMLEHAITAISMGFISAKWNEIGHSVEQALAELADWGGADRAYFIVSTSPMRMYSWSRDDNAWPDEWPMRAMSLASCVATGGQEVVQIQNVDDLVAGPGKDALEAAGLRGWVCIRASGEDGNGSLLGFDAVRAPMNWPSDELGLLRMAVVTVSNAAGRARLEREQVRLESSLQQARRMETVGALTSGIAHNFNNIIGAILGYAEMQEAQVTPGSSLARDIQGIRLAAERGRDLIDQILTFGHRRELSRRHVDLQGLITETAALLSASLPHDAKLMVDAVPTAAVVFGDYAQLQQVIVNLCNNAVQSMTQNCIVNVTTDLHTLAEPLVLSHGRLSTGRYVCIAVRDSGRGMDAATLERVFEPFFTTRPEGNGLGLATVQEIVASHNGVMNVQSQLGRGSVFEVWLPQAGKALSAQPMEALAPEIGKGQTILLIDDDPARLLHDEEIVAALGYEPIGFAEPGDALAACQATPQRFDATLIGNVTPIAAALALSRALHKATPSLPILLAASARELGAEVLTAAGVCEVVSKPLVYTELASALSRCLAA